MKTLSQARLKLLIVLAATAFFFSAGAFSHAEPRDGKTNLDFDGSVIEGVDRNARNLNSLMMVGMDNSGKNGTLFKKKEHFHPEIEQNLRDMGDSP